MMNRVLFQVRRQCTSGVRAFPRASGIARPFSTSMVSRKDINEDQTATLNKFAETLKSNPELSRLLDGFQGLLAEKGITTNGQPPSMTQMMRMLADKDIRNHLTQLKDVLQASNIQINQQDLSALTDLYMSQKKN